MEKEIIVTYEALFELLMREKGREALQPLEEHFFQTLAQYLQEKRASLESVSMQQQFASESMERTAKQLQNIYRMVRELYERRERKILNMALVRSRTGSDVMDTSSLLREEMQFLEDATTNLNRYRKAILHEVLGGNAPQLESSEQQEVLPKLEAAGRTARLRFLTNVDAFVGRELETYGPYKQGQVAELPGEIARILLSRGNVEKVA